MHAVSQGALGVECRLDDDLVISMLNRLSDEDTLLRCVAERAFLTTLNGGCSAPIGVNSIIVDDCIHLEGVVLSLDGENKSYDKFETSFSSNDTLCPISVNQKQVDNLATSLEAIVTVSQDATLPQHYTYIVDKNIDSKKLQRAEFCGVHLGHMLISKGADRLIEESKLQIKKN